MSNVTEADLAHAANVLVTTGLKLLEREHFVVVCDADSTRIAEALRAAASAIPKVRVTVCDLDRLESLTTTERPHRTLPEPLRQAVESSNAIAYVASAPHAETTMLAELLHIAMTATARHAHLPGVTDLAFARGLRTDHAETAAWGDALMARLDGARTIEATSDAGTELSIELAPDSGWLAYVGTMVAGSMTSFPAGLLCAEPAKVSGVFAANASLGEFFGAREGLLLEHPVRFTIEAGRVVRVDAPHAPSLKSDIEAMMQVAPNSDRVGVVALGVNVGIESPTGIAAVDLNMPSVHLVIGDSAGKTASPTFSARTSFAACSAGATVRVDGLVAIDRGKLVRLA